MSVYVVSFGCVLHKLEPRQMAAHTYFVGKSDRVTSVVFFKVDLAQYVVVQFVSGQDTGL